MLWSFLSSKSGFEIDSYVRELKKVELSNKPIAATYVRIDHGISLRSFFNVIKEFLFRWQL